MVEGISVAIPEAISATISEAISEANSAETHSPSLAQNASLDRCHSRRSTGEALDVQDKIDDDSQAECTICMSNSANSLLVPCHHTLCQACFIQIAALARSANRLPTGFAAHRFKNSPLCPFCRTRIDAIAPRDQLRLTSSEHDPPASPQTGSGDSQGRRSEASPLPSEVDWGAVSTGRYHRYFTKTGVIVWKLKPPRPEEGLIPENPVGTVEFEEMLSQKPWLRVWIKIFR
ncbi:uncharacterized protein BJ171DRAFT_501520 [Polychytrium aggregatum]|uniref:uncharacterized protein n=1 Tax=Polychytrium aggregatum TaxID=110093 RepID=UPI0022FEB74E|nr:uncharacterized protein BJ171DRAFT_501520 [Polychytrium aggregatum]KAI9205251.1 hypothetical protein BJ171DRAFT_501520 [Polychytrium aggregatum]